MTRYFRISAYLFLTAYYALPAQVIHENYSARSVLSEGKWYKLAVAGDGIYRIDFSELKALGLDYPSKPRIFGNNCGQLSFFNDGSAPDDLKEISVFESTGSDGILNEGDYILFYGQATHRWVYDDSYGDFSFKRHNYSDTAFYFLTSGPAEGKKVLNATDPALPANFNSSSSDANYIHEIEAENLIRSGREWYEPLAYLRDTEIDPGLKDVILSEPLKYKLRVLARSPSPSIFRFFLGGSMVGEVPVSPVDMSSTTGTYAQIAELSGTVLPDSQSPLFSVRYINNGELSARAWIDYVIIQARKLNTFEGSVAFYTDSRSVSPGNVTEFSVKTENSNVSVWDISDPFNARMVKTSRSGDAIKFVAATDTLKTFAAFVSDNTARPVIINSPVINQDLHSSPAADIIILTHPLFSGYSEKLAMIHKAKDNLVSLTVTPQQIYNEFSGGIPDIAAIRNFLRMKFLKQRGTAHPLRYLLLFGDGSYENKTPPPGNPNFIPTWQSKNSNVYVSSFCSDDFYGLLEDGEGEDSGTEDIAIGRIPASDTSQAATMLSKISEYLDPSNQGDWKNVVCLVADDEDGNTHMIDAEGLAGLLADSVPWINIDKIYFDAYHQITSATGEFYPDVSNAIDDRINSGTLIFNYIGHGNENSLAHERVLTSENIDSWKNKSKLPLFITATCEFSRFDDININIATNEITQKSSAGEKILFKNDGGAIALMSTSRLVYSAPNFQLNRNLFDAAFDRDTDGKPLCLGDIIRIAKNRSSAGINKRNFVLLGDPAVKLSYPWHGTVVVDSLNDKPVNEAADTIKALSIVNISGHVEDTEGLLMNSFDGTVEPLVFDKPVMVETLANDGGQKIIFAVQNNILFSGRTDVKNGRFSFSFIVPRDISYNYGYGKISFYASDRAVDLNGYYKDIITGGFSNVSLVDTTGPSIRIFLNDTLFINGGLTDPDPEIYAILEDPSGINATGSGIGHDIISWIDDDRDNEIVLNNYFENDPGSFVKGIISYDLTGLSAGRHSLHLKAWDNFNNSSEKSLSFIVRADPQFILDNLLNFPNPTSSSTKITLGHNRPGETLEVTITIYSLSGKVVRIIKATAFSEGYQLPPIDWDGNDSGGCRVGKGIYPYSVKIRSEKGETCTVSGRMIIL